MSNPFFEKPILNSPYEYPGRHWELDGTGQPTQQMADGQRDLSSGQLPVRARLPARRARLTINGRLRVLQPNDLDSHFCERERVPGDRLADLQRAKFVITNYQAFKLHERTDLSKGGRLLLQSRGGALLSRR